jgi:endonuclease G
MPDEPKPDRKKIQEAYEKAVKTFGQRANVTGIDIGYKYDAGVRTEEIAVRIHVREKIPLEALSDADIFPKDIDGIPVDVIQGHYSPSAEGILALLARRHRRNPIRPGISVSHSLVSAGTIAAVVFDRTTGAECILSNWHVLAGSIFAQPGDPIMQPGRFDGGRRETDTIGHLHRMYLGRRGDAAIAVLNGERQVSRIQDRTDVTVTATRRAGLGDTVAKSGRTTGVTTGVVDGMGRYRITYSVGTHEIEGFLIRTPAAGNPDNIEISGSGDSGALWYDPQTGEGLGLHFAGESDPAPTAEYALACHLDEVLDELNISLQPVQVAEQPAPQPVQPAPAQPVPSPPQPAATGPSLLDLLRGAGVTEEVISNLDIPEIGDAVLRERGVRITGGKTGPIQIAIDPRLARGEIRLLIDME